MIYKGKNYQLLPGASADFQYGFREDEHGFIQMVIVTNGEARTNCVHRRTLEYILSHLDEHEEPEMTADELYLFGDGPIPASMIEGGKAS